MSKRRNLRASLIKSFRRCEFQAQEGHATAELSQVLPVHKVHTAVSGTADENSARKSLKKDICCPCAGRGRCPQPWVAESVSLLRAA